MKKTVITLDAWHKGQTIALKRNKYGNRITEYNGQKYHSRKEAEYARTLDTLKNARFEPERVVNYQTQVKYPLDVLGVHIANYLLDFKVEYADGHIEYVDVKGVVTDVYAMKKKLMLALYGISIKEV